MRLSLRIIDLYEEKAVTDAVTAFLLWDKLSRSISPSYCPEGIFQIAQL